MTGRNILSDINSEREIQKGESYKESFTPNYQFKAGKNMRAKRKIPEKGTEPTPDSHVILIKLELTQKFTRYKHLR
jgi:hypothetical protein